MQHISVHSVICSKHSSMQMVHILENLAFYPYSSLHYSPKLQYMCSNPKDVKFVEVTVLCNRYSVIFIIFTMQFLLSTHTWKGDL